MLKNCLSSGEYRFWSSHDHRFQCGLLTERAGSLSPKAYFDLRSPAFSSQSQCYEYIVTKQNGAGAQWVSYQNTNYRWMGELTYGLSLSLVLVKRLRGLIGSRHRRLQSCVGTRAWLGYATFDAQLWKAYFVSTLYTIRTSVTCISTHMLYRWSWHPVVI